MNKSNRLLLVHPPKLEQRGIFDNLCYPPLGLAILAGILRQSGIKPLIYDAQVEKGDHLLNISRLIDKEKIEIIGLSFTTILAQGAYYLADNLKKKFPRLTIVAGGYHPTVMPEEVMEHPSIDYVIAGEGEITLPKLLRSIFEGGDLAHIEGLYFRKNGRIIYTGQRHLLPTLDDLPLPEYGLLKLNRYSSLSSTRRPFATIIRSRGCPFRCLFCGVDAIFSRRYRCQSPEKTLEEVAFLVKQYNVKEVLFKDSDFLIDPKNVEALCELFIKQGLDITWSCSTRVDRINKNILRLMKRAGCKQITFGIESGSQKILDSLRKDFTVSQVIEAVALTKEQHIDCVGGFIIGSPGEDLGTINETLRLIRRIPLDYASFQFLTAFPGSALYDLALKKHWFLNGRACSYEEANINASNLSEQELRRAMAMMIRAFYFRPSYILNRLSKLSPLEIRNNLVGGCNLIGKILKH